MHPEGLGTLAWLWNAVSADFFLPSRSVRVAMMLFGSTEGIVFLVCDRYAACKKLARELDGSSAFAGRTPGAM